MKPLVHAVAALLFSLSGSSPLGAAPLSFAGGNGPGAGKHIVLLAGDEEYRSEESMPMLARILSQRHGFDCTVLFSVNPADGTIDPMSTTNIPGLEVLKRADLCIMALRFRELPESQVVHVADYLRAGKPLIGLRTSTHAFAYGKASSSAYAHYDWRSSKWPGGFGRQVLGETWVSHHGDHGKESTRGIINPALKDHPVLKGVGTIWGPTDVYTVKDLDPRATILMFGEVLEGMKPDSKSVAGPKNEPLMPLIWIREYKVEGGRAGRAMTSTIGAAVDLADENLRRVLVNGCYWLTGLGEKIPEKSNVHPMEEYNPSYFGFGKFKRGLKPQDLKTP
jgi:hypothetical protein